MDESAVDRAIREATERGAFDNLPGKGKPLPQLADDSEDWWLRGYLRREGVSSELLLLPPSVQLRKEIDRLPETLRRLRFEREVRDAVAELNVRVAEHLRFPSGPRIPIRPVDADAAVARWRAEAAPAPRQEEALAPPPRTRWWQRRAR